MKIRNKRLYIAYGSNLNLEQMEHRCPTAEVVGKAVLQNWRLRFRGDYQSAVATIERGKGFRVPVLVWRLQPKDELALDHYEGFPFFYRKETLQITVNQCRAYAMVYIMNETRHPYGTPSSGYLATIREGYENAGFDIQILDNAAKEMVSGIDGAVREQIMAIRDSGETNMLDTAAVQRIANRKGYYELVVYLEEHRRSYISFILTGRTGEEE